LALTSSLAPRTAAIIDRPTSAALRFSYMIVMLSPETVASAERPDFANAPVAAKGFFRAFAKIITDCNKNYAN
jgi:hypothetical protein